MSASDILGAVVFPAATARALLAGFAAVGLDAPRLRDAAGIRDADLEPIDGVLPLGAFERLWAGARAAARREELPTEVGLAVPFGAFGPLDYLAASAETVEAAFHALASHFRQVAIFSLEVSSGAQGGEVRIVRGALPVPEGVAQVSDEFTIAVFVGRFRVRSPSPPFRASAVRLTRPRPSRPTRHEALLGCPVSFGRAAAAIDLPPDVWRARLAGADPALQGLLRDLAERIGLGAAASDTEMVVRARLRSLLPEGRAGAGEVARALGTSARTLQRRLRDAGRTFAEVLEAFREAEAERLLAAGTPLGEVALRLGYSDQTAWNRAFRRWKGMPPSEWLGSRGERGAAPPPGRGGRSRGRPPPRRR